MTDSVGKDVLPAVTDTWYAAPLELTQLSDLTSGRFARVLAKRSAGRGVLLWLAGRRYERVVTTLATTPRSFLLLERMFPRRRRYLVVLEFIPVIGAEARALWGAPAGRLRNLVSSWTWRFVAVPALRRCMVSGHCLTGWETARSARELGVPETRFTYVPWFRCSEPPADHSGGTRAGVLASGRAACDWETVFEASRGQGWPLTVVCGAPDLERVKQLNHDGAARVLSEIPRTEHGSEVEHASVYLLALREADVSSGQVRLSTCWDVCTPVVASSVKGLDGYLSDGENALVFPPGDSFAARNAVNALLKDDALRATLSARSSEAALLWTRDDYLRALHVFVHSEIPS